MTDNTHSPTLKSWIPVDAESDFPIQNIPFGVFRPKDGGNPRVGTAIGDFVVDLALLDEHGFFTGPELKAHQAFKEKTLNKFMSLGRPAWREARRWISELLSEDCPELRDNRVLRDQALLPQDAVEMLMPAEVGDYTDFYSSKEHAHNVGTMFRGADNALMPNWVHLPVAYHGRASSLLVSGQDIHRPQGQTNNDPASPPEFGPCRLMDFELEMGFFVGPGNDLGSPIPVNEAENHIFGMLIVNDWSARDIQKWEYQPLGPFLAKNFATTISPWIITLDALEPFRCAGPKQDPEPLPYLRRGGEGAYDITLDVAIQTEKLDEPHHICRSNFKYLYWDMRQQLAHHTVTGCNCRPGDLMASGTISGPDRGSRGSLLEITWKGSEPLELPNGESRKFLQDGDSIIMQAYCQGDGYRIGFGQVSNKVLPVKETANASAATV